MPTHTTSTTIDSIARLQMLNIRANLFHNTTDIHTENTRVRCNSGKSGPDFGIHRIKPGGHYFNNNLHRWQGRQLNKPRTQNIRRSAGVHIPGRYTPHSNAPAKASGLAVL